MGINIIEIHHPAVRIKGDDTKLEAKIGLYQKLSELSPDSGRSMRHGMPGFWINVGATGPIHLIGDEQPSRLAKSPDKDSLSPHITLADLDIAKAKTGLESRTLNTGSSPELPTPKPRRCFCSTRREI